MNSSLLFYFVDKGKMIIGPPIILLNVFFLENVFIYIYQGKMDEVFTSLLRNSSFVVFSSHANWPDPNFLNAGTTEERNDPKLGILRDVGRA